MLPVEWKRSAAASAQEPGCSGQCSIGSFRPEPVAVPLEPFRHAIGRQRFLEATSELARSEIGFAPGAETEDLVPPVRPRAYPNRRPDSMTGQRDRFPQESGEFGTCDSTQPLTVPISRKPSSKVAPGKHPPNFRT